MRQIKDLVYEVQATTIKYEGKNYLEILGFVGLERFRLSLGELSIKTRNDQMKVVNDGDFIILLPSGLFEVVTHNEALQLGLVEPEELEPEPELEEDLEESKEEVLEELEKEPEGDE